MAIEVLDLTGGGASEAIMRRCKCRGLLAEWEADQTSERLRALTTSMIAADEAYKKLGPFDALAYMAWARSEES